MVLNEGSTSQYWNYTGLILAQFEGLMEGYKLAVVQNPSNHSEVRMHVC
jgi:hypothetical protein